MSDTTARIQSAIDRFNVGDLQALDDIFARSARRMEQLARRMLHGSFQRIAGNEQTGDIVQEASIRLLRALRDMRDRPDRVETPLSLLRLAATMIRRTLHDLTDKHTGKEGTVANRANARLGPGTSSTPGVDPSADSADSPERLTAWREFHEAVEKLDDRLKAVFDLLWYEELTQEEAAKLLGVSVPTVKRHWREAKVALLDILPDGLPDTL